MSVPLAIDDLPAAVRAACALVMAEAIHVRIDAARLPGYAAALPLDAIPAAEYDLRYHFRGDPEETAAFVLMLDAINFGSGYFPHLRKRPGESGYFTIAGSLTDRFRAHGPLSARELAALGADDCRAIFGQVPDGGPINELMALFASSLNELGHHIAEHYHGRFAAPIEAANGSATRLVALLAAMPFFRDVAAYRGRAVPFYKRAQITIADLVLAFNGAGLGAFSDLDRLTIFADNLVPHVLRTDGLLYYDETLATHIASGEPLAAGSPEEVEIRAAAVHTAELLVAACAARGQHITARELDYLLWNRGLAPIYREQPRHRTRTTAY
jgi:Queuosine salvage protein